MYTAKVLLEYGADVNSKCQPIDKIWCYANANAQNNYGQTPLQLAAKRVDNTVVLS
jgi:ankyrin repeat protein